MTMVLLRGTDDKGVCVLVVTDRFVHEQFPNPVAVLSDRNKGGFLIVVCHRSLHEHRRDLMPIRSENNKLQARGILEVLRRFDTCRDHPWVPLRWCFGCSTVFPRAVPNRVGKSAGSTFTASWRAAEDAGRGSRPFQDNLGGPPWMPAITAWPRPTSCAPRSPRMSPCRG